MKVRIASDQDAPLSAGKLKNHAVRGGMKSPISDMDHVKLGERWPEQARDPLINKEAKGRHPIVHATRSPRSRSRSTVFQSNIALA